MRRYHQPAEVVFGENGEPVKFMAWAERMPWSSPGRSEN